MAGLFDDIPNPYQNKSVNNAYGIPEGMLFENAMQNLGRTSGILLRAGMPQTSESRVQVLGDLGKGDPNGGLKEMMQLQAYAEDRDMKRQQFAQQKAAQGMMARFIGDLAGDGSGAQPQAAPSAPSPSIGAATGAGNPMSSGGAPAPMGAPAQAPAPMGAPQASSGASPQPQGEGSSIAGAPIAPGQNTTRDAQVVQAVRTGNVSKWSQLTGLPPEALRALGPSLIANPAEGLKTVYEAIKAKAADDQKQAQEKRYGSTEYAPGQYIQRDQYGNTQLHGTTPEFIKEEHKKLGEKRDQASAAANNIRDVRTALSLIDRVIAGPAGGTKLAAGEWTNWLRTKLGVSEETLARADYGDVAATNEVKSLLARMAAEKGKAIYGGGQGFTDKEGEAVKEWATGNFNTQGVPSIKRILTRGIEIDERSIKQYGDARARWLKNNEKYNPAYQRDFETAYNDVGVPEAEKPAARPEARQQGRPETSGPTVTGVVSYGGKTYNVVKMPDGSTKYALPGGGQ